MDNYGVILKKLRLVNRLTIKEAAKKIEEILIGTVLEWHGHLALEKSASR